MFFFILVWIIILLFVILAYLFSNQSLNYVAFGVWIVSVVIKGWEKIENYKDWCKKNKRDEKNKLEEVAQEMAERGLTFSGIRNKKEKEVREDFEYERRARKRRLLTELFESLILK